MFESQIIRQELLNLGCRETNKKEECDIYIINSCSVTSHADSQTKYLIKQIKKDNKKAKIILTGCGAQTKNLKGESADLILGNSEKLNIKKYINILFKESQNLKNASFKNDSSLFAKQIYIKDISQTPVFDNEFLLETAATRPPVKIQDGCNNRCSYCIIPFARGNSRSNAVNNIIEQINILAAIGKKEVVLTGIHIGQYDYQGQKLHDLLEKIEETEILRYRLGSLYPDEINEPLFNFLKKSKKFCPHFHLSLQSLCNKTLKNMHRRYTKEQALDTVKKIKDGFNLPFVGCDIITGFPDETEKDFKETKSALIKSGVSYIHSFPYSKRKGTIAYDMKNQVLEHEKKERTKELIEVCKVLHGEFLAANKNTTRTILYEKKGKNGLYSGVSENYIKVYKQSPVNIQNTIEIVNLSAFEHLY